MSEGLHTAVSASASNDDLSAAAWFRRLAATEVGHDSDRDLQRSLPRDGYIPPEDVAAVSRLTGQVGMLGGLLVQAAKHTRELSYQDLHYQIEDALARLRTTQAELVAVTNRLSTAARRRRAS